MIRMRFIAAATFAVALATPVTAQDATHMTACTTKAECDLRADERDRAARQAQWDATVHSQEQYRAQARDYAAQTRATNIAGRAARSRDIMHRRATAAAAGHN